MYHIYQVRENETLDDIAKHFNTTIEELMLINGFIDEEIKKDQYIIVPIVENKLFDIYIVKSGDTLYSIAQQYNTNFRDLLRINGLEENDYIYKGQEIMVPTQNLIYHITEVNDTLESVCHEMNVNPIEIIE